MKIKNKYIEFFQDKDRNKLIDAVNDWVYCTDSKIVNIYPSFEVTMKQGLNGPSQDVMFTIMIIYENSDIAQ